MAIVKYIDQLEYTGQGPLDRKLQPVKTTEGLNDIPKKERYPGMTVTVMDDGTGKQQDFWLVGTDGYTGTWEKKTPEAEISVEGDDVEINQ